MGQRKKNFSDGGSVNCKECDSNIVTGKESAIPCDICIHWFHGGCLKLSEQQIDVLTDMPGCKWFSALRIPSITVKPFRENRNKTRQEVKNLESKISTIENSPEKIAKLLSSPVSYAEIVKSTTFCNDMKFQRPKYPLNGRFSLMRIYNTNSYIQVCNKKNN